MSEYRDLRERYSLLDICRTPDLATIERVMTARTDAYGDRDYCVTVDGKNPATVAHTVARWYRRRVAELASNVP